MVLRDGAPHLDAASLCFPSYWRLADKLGRPMADVHGPVAHYGDELAAKVDTFLQRLRPERPVWRRNWSIHDDPSYFLPDPTPPLAVSPPEGLYLRSERQTLRRLTTADVVLFTIRTQQVPLAVLAERPDVAHRLADAIAHWSPELAAYKGDHGALGRPALAGEPLTSRIAVAWSHVRTRQEPADRRRRCPAGPVARRCRSPSATTSTAPPSGPTSLTGSRRRCSAWAASGARSASSGSSTACTPPRSATPAATRPTPPTRRPAAAAPATPRSCSWPTTPPR